MNWFEQLTGFREGRYADVRSKLYVEGSTLHSRVNGAGYAIGDLELTSLSALRGRVQSTGGIPGRIKVKTVVGNVRQLHRSNANSGALFQVASQFNLLEMIGPNVTPEDGVTVYESDHTQGPACAIAAGAATIYRNYFAPVDGGIGQTADRQINALSDIGGALASALGTPVQSLWTMQNGYALCTASGLDAIAAYLDNLSPANLDNLRALHRIGLHRDVEVTDAPEEPRPLVSQAFCSALPVAYTRVPAVKWEPFASLILEAAYEATLLAAILNAKRGASNVVFLTQLGGGAFGNLEAWIAAAIERAIERMADSALDVRIVSYGSASRSMEEIARRFA